MSPMSDSEHAAVLPPGEDEKLDDRALGNGDVKHEDVTDPAASEVEHEHGHEHESSVDNATAATNNEIHADNTPAGDVDANKPSDPEPAGNVQAPANPEPAVVSTQSPKPDAGTVKASASPLKAVAKKAASGAAQSVKKVRQTCVRSTSPYNIQLDIFLGYQLRHFWRRIRQAFAPDHIESSQHIYYFQAAVCDVDSSESRKHHRFSAI